MFRYSLTNITTSNLHRESIPKFDINKRNSLLLIFSVFRYLPSHSKLITPAKSFSHRRFRMMARRIAGIWPCRIAKYYSPYIKLRGCDDMFPALGIWPNFTCCHGYTRQCLPVPRYKVSTIAYSAAICMSVSLFPSGQTGIISAWQSIIHQRPIHWQQTSTRV